MIPQVIDLGDGRELVLNIRPKKVIQEKPKPQNLEQIWLENHWLSFEQFKSELIRMGHLSENDNKLRLTGKQIRHLYRALVIGGAIRELADMVDVYAVFSGTFILKIKSVSSLQRIMDDEDAEDFWINSFAFCVRNSNATNSATDQED